MSSPMDRVHRLRSLDRCKVGGSGYWTVHPEGESWAIDYLWWQTSVILSIEANGLNQGQRAEVLDAGALYAAAGDEWSASGNAAAWDNSVGDGLEQDKLTKGC